MRVNGSSQRIRTTTPSHVLITARQKQFEGQGRLKAKKLALNLIFLGIGRGPTYWSALLWISSKSDRFQANLDKSHMMLVGVNLNTKGYLLSITRFQMGELPPKYLGALVRL